MKKIIYLLLVIITSSLFSCSDWLEVSPKSEVEASELFEDEAGFKQALIGVYLAMADRNAYGENLSWHFLEILAQQYVTSSGSYLRYSEYDYTNRGRIDNIWKKNYFNISQVNKLLEMINLKGDVLNPVVRNVCEGEALAARALLHFDLLRLYCVGNLERRSDVSEELAIPYVTAHTHVITPQLSYNETFALLEADLTKALELLKDDPRYIPENDRSDEYFELTKSPFFNASPGYGRERRLNYLAVKALQARVYLWEGKKVEALEAAESAIDQINKSIGKGSLTWAKDYNVSFPLFLKEHLFCLHADKLKDYMEGYYNHNTAGGNFNTERLIQSDDFLKGIFDYENEAQTDLRYRLQHEKTEVSNADWFLTVKLRFNESDLSGYHNNVIPMIKMSEPYLIAAECYADGESQNLLKSIEYLNLLKDKRNIEPEYFLPETTVKDDLLMEINKEYRKEFIQEGQLFFYYKRKGFESFPGIGGTVMSDAKYTLPYPELEMDLGQRGNGTDE